MRLIPAPIELFLSPDPDKSEMFKREFDALSESDDDPIGHWVKMAKARGETRDSDQVLLTLLVELHRKVDTLLERLDERKKELLELESYAQIKAINFDYFELHEESLIAKERYYGRIHMPTFPQREIPAYFIAEASNLAKIVFLHNRDKREWDSYVTARERVMIREMKGNYE